MFFNIDDNLNTSLVVTGKGGGPNNNFGTWNIPQSSKYVTFICIGAGGGGGAGAMNQLSNSKSGGGGGGSGVILSATYHTSFLPESIVYCVGSGGPGGTSNTSGGLFGGPGLQGGRTYVSLPYEGHITASAETILAYAEGGNGGQPSLGSDGGAGATAYTTNNFSLYPLSSMSYFIEYDGGVGGKGGYTNNPPPNLYSFNGSPLTGGTGGGNISGAGVSQDGGSIISTHSFLPTIVGGSTTGSSLGIDGSWSFKPLGGTGGTGGPGTNTTKGNGGKGSYGCGGGGGGAGISTSPGSSGDGGAGGDGMLIILAW